MSLTNDWLIGNANDVALDNFQDEFFGTVENEVEAYLSLCHKDGKVITGATNTTPIVITAVAHGFANGDVVTVVNVGGNGAAKGTFAISSVTTDTFRLVGSAGDGDYTGGGEAYRCITDASALEFENTGEGSYLVSKDGDIPLTDQQQLKLVIYCLGAFRDLYNCLIDVVARRRSG